MEKHALPTKPIWRRHKHFLSIVGVAMIVALALVIVVISGSVIGNNKRYILRDPAAKAAHSQRIGMVLGAGITKEGTPFKELRSRLDVAADSLQAGYVDKLILSGDNRFAGYDEPGAMKRYLVEQRGVAATKLQPDYAGRSTYESCERAAKVFIVNKLVVFSAESHLPRAIYLCRHFGIETYGVASTAEANNATRREVLARVKALYNTHIKGEPTILGSQITL